MGFSFADSCCIRRAYHRGHRRCRPENEHLIQQALRELRKGKTTLMIAHRLTTVKDAEKTIESGSHDELVNAGRNINSLLIGK